MTSKAKPHGGARPGAGRPPDPPILMAQAGSADPLEFLLGVMNDTGLDMRLRADAAKSLMPFLHEKPGLTGKKEQRDEAAKKVAGGKFAASLPPLRAVP